MFDRFDSEWKATTRSGSAPTSAATSRMPGGGELWSVRLSLLALSEAQCRLLGQKLAEGVRDFARQRPCAHCVALRESQGGA